MPAAPWRRGGARIIKSFAPSACVHCGHDRGTCWRRRRRRQRQFAAAADGQRGRPRRPQPVSLGLVQVGRCVDVKKKKKNQLTGIIIITTISTDDVSYANTKMTIKTSPYTLTTRTEIYYAIKNKKKNC